jgi:transposase
LGWRKGYPRQFSPDPDDQAKVSHLLSCLEPVAADPQPIGLVFLDEMGFWRWAEAGQDWMIAAPVPVTRMACAGTNRQWRSIGALNAFSGQLDYLDNYIVGRKVVAPMYPKLDSVYDRLERLYGVQDNWSIHKHTDVQMVLKQLPRLEVVWLPTSAHWLNPIEKLWRWLRQDVLRLHPWAADWNQLLGHLRSFLNQFAHRSSALLR